MLPVWKIAVTTIVCVYVCNFLLWHVRLNICGYHDAAMIKAEASTEFCNIERSFSLVCFVQ